MIDRVDNETKEARLLLLESNSNESKGMLTTQSRAAHTAKMVTWSMQINSLSGFESRSFWATIKEYQSWWAVFSSCVDETNLSAQFKMLRPESCLEIEVAETVKELDYSDHAYEAAKARMNRKYGEQATGSSPYRWAMYYYLASTTDGLKKREAWSLLTSCVTGLLRKLSTSVRN